MPQAYIFKNVQEDALAQDVVRTVLTAQMFLNGNYSFDQEEGRGAAAGEAVPVDEHLGLAQTLVGKNTGGPL